MGLAGQPLVGITDREDHPELVFAHVPGLAGRNVEREVRRDLGDALNQRVVAGHDRSGDGDVVRRGQVAAGELAVGEIGLQQRRGCARAIVVAEPVAAPAAIVGQAVLEGGEGVARHAGANRQERLVRGRLGGEVDHPAAEFTREIGRIALLHQCRGDHPGREDIERDDPLERLGAGQRRTVEQRERIAVTQTADIDIAAADHAEAGHAGERAGDVAFAGLGDLFGREDRENLARAAGRIARAARAGDDDFAATGNRDLDALVGLIGLVGGSIHRCCGIGVGIVLGVDDGRDGQGGRYEQRADQPRCGGHGFTPH